MFDLDSWSEIIDIIRKNKLRTFLTALSVSWAIFLLIILLGFVNGLQNGVKNEFKGDATNSIWVSGGITSKPHKGMKPGRYIMLTNDDYNVIDSNVSGIAHLGARNHMWMQNQVTYGVESASFDLKACNPEYRYLEELEMIEGRFVNALDMENKTKVCVIGDMVLKQLKPNGGSLLGEYLTIEKVPFKVVGIFKDEGGERDQRRIYIPISTEQVVYNNFNRIHSINMTTNTIDLEESRKMEKQILNAMAVEHNFDKTDVRALRVWNNLERFMEFISLFTAIEVVMWFSGIMTLIAGIIGVSNVMTIIVKERTKEIGIRKALGAPPMSILMSIMQESILVTFFSGFLGLLLSISILEFNWIMVPFQYVDAPVEFIIDPTVDFSIAFTALGVLVLAGVIAGLIPSIRAASINPVEAIRDN